MINSVPSHLRKYIVEQDYSRYTPQDQAVWRYVLRQLRSFMIEHAHPCYADGLLKTGIDVERIPRIEEVSEKLSKFGWQALPVSGFIPPAAFMELQALSFLPIASDMRTIDHLKYTPAPDIVHEAAGHAPILVDPEFAAYLKQYASVARKAIISKQDMLQYEAIRILSDLKEDPNSTAAQIQKAENELAQVSRSISHVSEAALLGRMNWWTAEYGLIGNLENPKIFGAGLLSSVGESKDCLKSHVRKIPLSIECLDYSYDITEPQPQLFVTKNFSDLSDVLEQLAARMAFRMGGLSGLKLALRAETVNTVELDSGLQISGVLQAITTDSDPILTAAIDTFSSSLRSEPIYLQFSGGTQLCVNGAELPGHGVRTHAQGFGMPTGQLNADSKQKISSATPGQRLKLTYISGIEVSGVVTGLTRRPDGKLILISFNDCTVKNSSHVFFDPSWGQFDLSVGEKIVSVFGGPADRERFGVTDDFAAKIIPRKSFDSATIAKHRAYSDVRSLRERVASTAESMPASNSHALIVSRANELAKEIKNSYPNSWLLRVEMLEIASKMKSLKIEFGMDGWPEDFTQELERMKSDPNSSVRNQIEDGLRLVNVH